MLVRPLPYPEFFQWFRVYGSQLSIQNVRRHSFFASTTNFNTITSEIEAAESSKDLSSLSVVFVRLISAKILLDEHTKTIFFHIIFSRNHADVYFLRLSNTI